MFPLLWLLYLLFISAVVAFFSYALFFRKVRNKETDLLAVKISLISLMCMLIYLQEELKDSTPVRTKINYLKKVSKCAVIYFENLLRCYF